MTHFNHLCRELVKLTSQHLDFLSRCHRHSISQYRNIRNKSISQFQEYLLRYHASVEVDTKRRAKCACAQGRELFSMRSDLGPRRLCAEKYVTVMSTVSGCDVTTVQQHYTGSTSKLSNSHVFRITSEEHVPVKEFSRSRNGAFLGTRKRPATHPPPQITLGLKLSVPRFQSHSQKFFCPGIRTSSETMTNMKICAVHVPPCWHVALPSCHSAPVRIVFVANVLFPCATFRASVVCHQLMQLLRTVFSCVASHRFGRCFDAHGREDSQRAPENCSHDGWVPFGSHHNRADSTRASMSVTYNVYVLTRSKKNIVDRDECEERCFGYPTHGTW